MDRRIFIKVSGGAVLGAGLVAGGFINGTKQAEAAPTPDKWGKEFDVVVIGTGFSGRASGHRIN